MEYPKKFLGSDIEIAQSVFPKYALHIDDVAKRAEISEEYIEHYGKYKAKVNYSLLNDNKDKEDGKLILVTAINING